MNLNIPIPDLVRQQLPPNTKRTPKGWWAFNAPCCHHRGHRQDDRKRGGIRFEKGGVSYNCFNCGFTTGWMPGWPAGEKLKSLMRWMGASEDTINAMVIEALKSEAPDYESSTPTHLLPRFELKSLPPDCKTLAEWVQEGTDDKYFLEALVYVTERGFDPLDPSFCWTPDPALRNRLILPFKFQNEIVGYTGRRFGGPKKGRYLADQPSDYVFNTDAISEKQKYLFVVEGPFDAIATKGVALLGSSLSDKQAYLIEQLGPEIIVIPDQDREGLALADEAIERGWRVAFPTWDDSIKDAAEASQQYSALFVAVDAIQTSVSGPAQYAIPRAQFVKKIERIEEAERLAKEEIR